MKIHFINKYYLYKNVYFIYFFIHLHYCYLYIFFNSTNILIYQYTHLQYTRIF